MKNNVNHFPENSQNSESYNTNPSSLDNKKQKVWRGQIGIFTQNKKSINKTKTKSDLD